MGKVFLDSNIFLYAVGVDSPHKQSCRDVLSAVGDGKLDAVTSSEVLREVLHVRARSVGLKDAVQATRAAAALVAEVLPVTGEDVFSACRILERHPQMAARDALHIAVMEANHLHTLISVDKDFDSVKDIKRVRPEDST